MKEYRKIFMICRNDRHTGNSGNYCRHGPMGEMEDAIGYGTLLEPSEGRLLIWWRR